MASTMVSKSEEHAEGSLDPVKNKATLLIGDNQLALAA
jgi:hypothetical protein